MRYEITKITKRFIKRGMNQLFKAYRMLVCNPFRVGLYAFLFSLPLTDQVEDTIIDSSLIYLD
jgi:hypothetical protein